MMRKIEANVAPNAAEAAQTAYNDAVPMKRDGEPEEVANVIAFFFLLFDDALCNV